jgi:hypothetical protein
VGDFVLKRADGCSPYQLAVFVDDADQGITHVVRGEDLVDNTAAPAAAAAGAGTSAALLPAHAAGAGPHGEKLSKQNGAAALDLTDPRAAVSAAAAVLGIAVSPQAALPASWRRRCAPGRALAVADNRGMSDEPNTPESVPSRAASAATCAAPAAPPSARPRRLETLGPQFLLPYQPQPLDLRAALRPRRAHHPGNRLRHGRGHGAHRRR